jgi:hypothetical protein
VIVWDWEASETQLELLREEIKDFGESVEIYKVSPTIVNSFRKSLKLTNSNYRQNLGNSTQQMLL